MKVFKRRLLLGLVVGFVLGVYLGHCGSRLIQEDRCMDFGGVWVDSLQNCHYRAPDR